MIAFRSVRVSFVAAVLPMLAFFSDTATASSTFNTSTDHYCGNKYCVTATYSPTDQNINYTLSVTNTGPLSGWYSIGQGSRMSAANMVIAWVNSDSSVTISQRSASGHQQPLTSQVPASAVFSVDTSNTRLINDTTLNLSWTFSQKSSPDKTTAHMFAHSSKTPSSSQLDASISMHDSYEQFNLELTKAYTDGSTSTSSQSSSMGTLSPSSSSTPSLPSNDSSSSERSANIFIAHMVFMIISWMLLVPFGALLARYGRTLFSWFHAHRAVQLGAVLFTLIGFSLGVAGLSAEGGPHLTEMHHRVGVLVLILAFMQATLGYWAHSYRSKTGRRHVGFIHMPLGIILFGLAVWNTKTGFELWSVQPSFRVAYIIYGWAGLVTLLYVGGLLLLSREKRIARGDRSINNQSQEELNLEKMQRRQVDGLMPVNEYNRYQQMNSSEVSFELDSKFDQH